MADIVKYLNNSSSAKIEHYGRHLYQTNKTFRDLGNIMAHPEFRKFIETYFDDSAVVNVMIMFIKIYQQIEKDCKVELTEYQKLALVHKIILNQNTRIDAIDWYKQNWANDINQTMDDKKNVKDVI